MKNFSKLYVVKGGALGGPIHMGHHISQLGPRQRESNSRARAKAVQSLAFINFRVFQINFKWACAEELVRGVLRI